MRQYVRLRKDAGVALGDINCDHVGSNAGFQYLGHL